MKNIYPWARGFDLPMPEHVPSEICTRLMPQIVAPGFKCRKCRIERSRWLGRLGKFRHSVKVNFAASNRKGECLSMRLVFPSNDFIWFGR